VEPVDDGRLVFVGTIRISLANDLTDHIDLWLELVHGLLGILVTQGFSLLSLPHDKLVLARLEIFVVSLVQLLLACEQLARVGDRRVEGVRV